jgi:hypothetical protein
VKQVAKEKVQRSGTLAGCHLERSRFPRCLHRTKQGFEPALTARTLSVGRCGLLDGLRELVFSSTRPPSSDQDHNQYQSRHCAQDDPNIHRFYGAACFRPERI